MTDEGSCTVMSTPSINTSEIAKGMPEFKKDLWSTPTAATHLNEGGQMITLSPPAGDPASQQEPAQGSSSSAGSDLTGDAEGVWSVDIDQAFQEALAIYPPCGRRKIIISDEGKMYGRNELIARYIKLRCGKTRTRKQVSSHIQVLARKKARDDQAKKKGEPSSLPPLPTPVTSSDTSAASLPPTVTQSQPPRVPNMPHFPQLPLHVPSALPLPDTKQQLDLISKTNLLTPAMYQSLWPNPFQMPNAFHTDLKFGADFSSPFAVVPSQPKAEPEPESRAIASPNLVLDGFTAYVKGPDGAQVDIVSIPKHVGELERLSLSSVSDKYPPLLKELFARGPPEAFFLAKCWANVQFNIDDIQHEFAVDSFYSSNSRFAINVCTKVCSFGSMVVEKDEAYSAEEEGDRFSFRLEKSPMCEYMVKFITELKKLESQQWMNNVLENFTVMQVVTNEHTKEILMVLCFVFEVSEDPEPSCSLFQLTE